MATSTKRGATRSRPPAKARAAGGFPLVPVLIGALVVLGIAVIIAVAISGGDDDTPAASTCEAAPVASSDTVTVRGAALSTPEGGSDPCIGKPAPELTGRDFANQPVEITDDGRAKAIAFVAHWCPHCQREVPIIADFLERDGLPDGVELYVVPTSTDPNLPNSPPDEWLQREGLGDVPTLVDDDAGTAHRAYGNGGFPYLVLVDKDGNVAGRFSGELGADAYPLLFDALAKGEPIPGTEEGPGSTSPNG